MQAYISQFLPTQLSALNSHDFLARRRYSTLTRSATLAVPLRSCIVRNETASISRGVEPQEMGERDGEREKEKKRVHWHKHIQHAYSHKRLIRAYCRGRGGGQAHLLCVSSGGGVILDPSLLRTVYGV